MPTASRSVAQPKSHATRQEAAIGVVQKLAKRDYAATLFAEDAMLPDGERKRTDQSVADAVGVSRNTIGNWKKQPEFQAMIQDAQGKIIADALRLPSAQKHQRIRHLHNISQRLLDTIELRSQTYTHMTDTPEEAARQLFGGGTPPWAATGLFTENRKMSASGKVITDWELDTAVIKELRATYEHIARETGQWTDKSEVQMDGGMRIEIVGIADEDMP